jgi:uncharacterized membrane protein YczE
MSIPSSVSAAAPATPAMSFDPIRFCVYTTVALLAWLVSPPVMVMAMSGLGLWAYWRAVRAGLTRSKCVLRNPKLVLLYLGTVFTAGAIGLFVEIARVF